MYDEKYLISEQRDIYYQKIAYTVVFNAEDDNNNKKELKKSQILATDHFSILNKGQF